METQKRGRGRPRNIIPTDTKAYNRAYYLAHKDKYFKPVLCEVCNRSVVHMNKHRTSKCHIKNEVNFFSNDKEYKEADI